MINLLIAWGCAAWSKPLLFDALLTADYRRGRWQDEERRPRLRHDHLWIRQAYRGGGLHLLVIQEEPRMTEVIHIHRAGWPLAAMEGRENNPLSPGTVPIGTPSYTAALPLPTEGTLLVSRVGGAVTTSPTCACCHCFRSGRALRSTRWCMRWRR